MNGPISIPDDSILEWMKTLREGGFDDKEIDSILLNLNNEYLKNKGEKFSEEKVIEEFNKIVNSYYETYKKMPSGVNKDVILEMIREKFGLSKK